MANGDQYRGGFVAGMRHGKGKAEYASGASYEGEWKLNKQQG